ncbi:GGDEF domain-containing protein [Acidovorax sp. sic0104]|uniref:GGDEF domain-containing protein n=1 Tax=Acidovorax sp. sic0104 TaxID=2854784 RepID=UPI001C475FD1|nr:GGDEF domain-containing protein [Acidovorax sp. sic0104]MBV7544109.1 GGDEF domain-containing protein [Acidovorax sp. sic0104]
MTGSATPGQAPDLFDAETQTLLAARTAHAACTHPGQDACGQALGDLVLAYERLLRETRRLVRRSDRAELEMTRMNAQLQELAAELEHRANHDPLTGVLNRAAIIELVNRHFGREDLALVVLDIDHFKRINDSFGHPMGDQVILGVVACLQAVVPPTAHVGRVGGEEFTVVLPQQDASASHRVAEALRQAIESHPFDLPDGSGVTASFGVCWAPAGSDFDSAYGLADEALYVAKRGGRNQVRVSATALQPFEHVV